MCWEERHRKPHGFIVPRVKVKLCRNSQFLPDLRYIPCGTAKSHMVSTQNHKSAQILLKHGPGQLRTPAQVLDKDWNLSQTECQVCSGICDPEDFTHVPTVVTEICSSAQRFSCIVCGTPYVVFIYLPNCSVNIMKAGRVSISFTVRFSSVAHSRCVVNIC